MYLEILKAFKSIEIAYFREFDLYYIKITIKKYVILK